MSVQTDGNGNGKSNGDSDGQTSEEAEVEYLVVVNHEEQYSIWPAGRALPAGWSDAGVQGPKERCLEHIEQVWVDMRPLSLRRSMDQGSST